ncbi:MAG: hypothetical protein FWC54_02650, partial [Actinomycetia bacterium]|nr:hypothetical protein [Actinomycetes bacterium]
MPDISTTSATDTAAPSSTVLDKPSGPSLSSNEATYAPPVESLSEAEKVDTTIPKHDKKATREKELPEKRTENTKIYKLSDGYYEAETSEAPLHYKNKKGAWVDIATDLVPGSIETSSYGTLSTLSTENEIAFSAFGEEGAASVTDNEGKWKVSLNYAQSQPKKALKIGNSAYYPEVAEGVDLEYDAMWYGLKETLVLTKPTKDTAFDFRMTFEGLELRRDLATSDYQLTDPATGQAVLDIGRLSVTDSAWNDKLGEFGTCKDAHWEVVESGEGWATIRANVDKQWIKDKERVWPVRIDPTLYINKNTTVPEKVTACSVDTYVSSAFPSTSHSGTTEMRIGNIPAEGTGYCRGLTNFALPDLSGMRIDSVKLTVQQFHQWYADGTATDTYVATLKGSVPAASTLWSNMPPLNARIGTATTTKRAQTVLFDITAGMRPYLRRESTFYGLGYYQAEDGTQNTTHWRKYYTIYAGAGGVMDAVYYPDYKPVTGLSYTTKASTDWFKEVDLDGDGTADNVNDRPEQGRGSVNLTWNADAQAKGYLIYAYDGNAYNVVGNAVGKNNTSWSSEGGGIFPRGNDIKGYNGTFAGNSYISASTPCDESFIAKTPLSMPAGSGTTLTGAGAIAFDGDDMYVKKWSTYPGPDQWVQFKKTAMTGGATSVPIYGAGQKIKTAVPGTTSLSGFTLNGVLYDGCATRVSGGSADISGFVLSTIMDNATQVTLKLSAPPLIYNTGADATAATSALLLASDGSRIYSAGKTATGFKVRIYDEFGTFIADKTYTLEGQAAYAYFDSFTVAGDNLYFYEWTNTTKARMTKASISRTVIVNQWYIESQVTNQSLSVVYDRKLNRFVMGQVQSGANIYSYSGLGEDLQDDPRTLYRGTNGSTYDNNTNYWFRVATYTDYESMLLGNTPYVTPTLENRTVRVSDASQREYRQIADIAGESVEGALSVPQTRIRTEDLRIAATGPAARIGRTYLSDMSYTSAYLPKGWMFSFEENALQSGTNVIYTDSSGISYTFIKGSANTYIAPNGLYATLSYDSGVVIIGRATFTLAFPDASKKIFDATSGKLISETDRLGKKTSYDITPAKVTIQASNGQKIILTQLSPGNLSALYETTSGKREFTYSVSGSTLSVKAYPGTSAEVTRSYTLTNQMLSSVAAAGDNVTFTYTTTTLAAEHTGASVPPARNKLTYATTLDASVKQTTFESGSTASERGFAAGYEKCVYLLNLAQQVIWKSVSATFGEGEYRRYNSENQMIGTSSPVTYSFSSNKISYKTTDQSTEELFTYDGKGYLVEHTSKLGGVTENYYNVTGDLIKQIDESRGVTWLSYNTAGQVLVTEKLISASGEKSRTEYTYDASGNLTQKRDALRKVGDAYEWAVTQYANFASCGAPQKITNQGVKLSPTATAKDLEETRLYDEFGNLIKDTLPLGTTVQGVYDIAGRLTSVTSPGGVVTCVSYDSASNPLDSYKTATGIAGKFEWMRETYNVSGNNTASQVLDPTGSELSKTSYTLDVMGREVTADDSDITGIEKQVYDNVGNVTEVLPEASTKAATTTTNATVKELTTYDNLNRPVYKNTAAVSTQGEIHQYDDHSLTMYCMHGGIIYKVTLDKAGNIKSVQKYNSVAGQTPAQVAAAKPPLQTTTTTYDLDNKPVNVSETPAGSSELTYTHVYDLMGRETSVQLSGQSATTYAYNTLGWLLEEKDFDGVSTTYVYNDRGDVIEQNRGGLKTTATYNSDGQLTQSTQDDGTVITYSYDALGRLT